MERIWLKLLPLLTLIVLLSGCSTQNSDGTARPFGDGVWDHFFVKPLSDFLDFIANLLHGQYGIALLVITLIIRFLLLPLTLKQLKSNRAARALQPEIVKLQAAHREDPQRLQEEMMKLYAHHKVNPMMGCLPIFIQTPILMALYHAITRNPDITHHDFLWLQLGTVDPWILPLLAAGITWLQQFMMIRWTNNRSKPAKIMSYVFPIMIFVMASRFPAAIALYWVYSYTFSLLQNYFIYGRNRVTK